MFNNNVQPISVTLIYCTVIIVLFACNHISLSRGMTGIQPQTEKYSTHVKHTFHSMFFSSYFIQIKVKILRQNLRL